MKVDVKKQETAVAISQRDKELARQVEEYNVNVVALVCSLYITCICRKRFAQKHYQRSIENDRLEMYTVKTLVLGDNVCVLYPEGN